MPSRRRRNLPTLEKLEIVDVAAEGKAIAKHNNKVVFVSNSIPGDIVDVQITRQQRNFFEGYPVKYHKYSDIRIEPFCEHFGFCGGCKWQNMPYKEQLRFKEKQVSETLKRIGKIKLPKIDPIIPSDKQTYYRNKLEYTFANSRWLTREEIGTEDDISNRNALGFHVPGKFDRILDINNCHLQDDPSNEIRLAFREYAFKHDLSFFDIRNKRGFLRNLIIRNTTIGEFMVILSVFEDQPDKIDGILEFIGNRFREITSLMYVVNPKSNDTLYDQDIRLFKGKDYIIEELGGIKFKIGPKSFFQTNSLQALKMYTLVKEYAGLSGNEIVYDLYTGTGTIANYVARNCKKVIGIESVPEAIEDAKSNSKINGISNTEFYAGDMKDMLTPLFIREKGEPDVMIIDPPRAGMHDSVIKSLLWCLPKKIVYVSCNPATQARDIGGLSIKYRVTKLQPLDMFPHTHHVENVALLELNER
ncbi:MAG: 23S rRNA (uracil(1939)-C(5))-methyltransferase RlmD [Bacteroidales bacterium]|nr:23S rRNA (uracil(1939)-C(5))-methyltransferase RlmD [Bacteroidales bacterium]